MFLQAISVEQGSIVERPASCSKGSMGKADRTHSRTFPLTAKPLWIRRVVEGIRDLRGGETVGPTGSGARTGGGCTSHLPSVITQARTAADQTRMQGWPSIRTLPGLVRLPGAVAMNPRTTELFACSGV